MTYSASGLHAPYTGLHQQDQSLLTTQKAKLHFHHLKICISG